jgi:hypothetical protein
MTRWKEYERSVAQIAPDLLLACGATGPITTKQQAWLPGRNGRHQIDVLAQDGRQALFVECKDHHRVLTKDAVSATIYNFLDVCQANRGLRWCLAIVSSSDIPQSAQMPALRPDGIWARVPNLARRTLAQSCSFVYFDPPRSPLPITPFLLHDDHVELLGIPGPIAAERLRVQLDDSAASPEIRVAAGLRLAALAPDELVQDRAAARTVVHGLLHFDRPLDAYYLLRLLAQTNPRARDRPVDELMIVHQIASRRYPRRAFPGRTSLAKLCALLPDAPPVEKLSIATFAGPVLAQNGEARGTELLASVPAGVQELESVDRNYYELLSLTREAQLSPDLYERAELLAHAKSLVGELPQWNQYFANGLLAATEADPRTLHGIAAPFDAAAWQVG